VTPFALPHAVIFDWDNTLVDSWDAIAFAMNKTLEHFGMPVWTREEVSLRCRRSARDNFPEWFGGDKWQEAYELFYQHFNVIRAKGATPALGASDLLAWFKKSGTPCFVVSNKRGPDLRKEVVTLQWNEFFVSLVGSGDATHDKPERDPIDMALGASGINAGPYIWFIGDTDVDVICARAADCTPVFVGDEAEARKLSVDLAFRDCVALQRWLETKTISS
jgi:phosphoglycolate phosphatase